MTVPFETRISRHREIVDAVTSNTDLERVISCLPGLFHLRNELVRCGEDFTELAEVERQIGQIIVANAMTYGVDSLADALYHQGIVESRGLVYRLSAPVFDTIDTQEDGDTQPVKLIGVVGRIASGKGTVGNILSEHCGSLHLPLSDRLREVADSEGVARPHAREALRDINDRYKPRFGNSVFVRWTTQLAKNLAVIYKKDFMTMDGFRSLEEAQYFKDIGGILIAINASDELRYQRLISRNRGADDFSREKFEQSDAIERE